MAEDYQKWVEKRRKYLASLTPEELDKYFKDGQARALAWHNYLRHIGGLPQVDSIEFASKS